MRGGPQAQADEETWEEAVDTHFAREQLDSFIDPESTYPVITCNSRLMTTGVDAQTCDLIVLDRRINLMTEFKQIIGRGILFAEPDFDGDPVQIYEPLPEEPPVPPTIKDALDEQPPGDIPDDGPVGPPDAKRYVVENVPVHVATERVQYLDENGKLITESLKDDLRKTLRKAYTSLDDFLTLWKDAERKHWPPLAIAGEKRTSSYDN